MKNREGFTMIELLVSFVIMAFILGIGVVSYRFIIDRIEANYYDTLEEELLLAGSDYYNNHREDKPISGYGAVYIDELVGDKYIETLKDRNGKVCSASNDSKVYIYKTDTGYDYETCLVCNDYKTAGAYCDGTVMGVINLRAVKADGTQYNPLLSYENNSWSNSDVTVTFSVNVPVTEFVITNTSNGSQRKCNNITNRSCSMVFSETSTYKVEAYDGTKEVAPDKGFNVKIDKTGPVCTFVSGPSVALINKSLTSTYVLECTDNVGLSNDYNISSSDLTLTKSNIVLIQNPSATAITNGYRYTIIVNGNISGTTALKLKAGVITDKAGNGNNSITSNNVEVDANAPQISYNLASGTYKETKTVTVTVTDNHKINTVEYKLYKDGVLVSSGNPTGSSDTSISFDSKLDSDGTWKLDVTAKDEAGNTTTDSRNFIIETVKNCWYEQDHYFDTERCAAEGTVGEGEQYITCSKLYRYNVMYAPQSTSTGTLVAQSCYLSQPNYTSEESARTACKENYTSTYSSPCYSRYKETNEYGKKYMFNCDISQDGYRNYVYKRVCE